MELEPNVIRRARRGDRAAQEVFIRRYAQPLAAFLRQSRAPGALEDLVQDLLKKLLEALPGFDPNGTAQLSTWVFRIAHHFAIDRRRLRKLALVPLDEGLGVADARAGSEELVQARQAGEALERALATLPEEYRRAFVLAKVNELALEAIAEIEGVPLGTVKSRLHRARALLAQALVPAFAEEKGVGNG